MQVYEHNHEVTGARLSRDGERIFSWSEDESVKIWSIRSSEPLQILKHDSPINHITLSEDEREVHSFGHNGTMKNHQLYEKIEVLKADEWREKKRKYEKRLEELNK